MTGFIEKGVTAMYVNGVENWPPQPAMAFKPGDSFAIFPEEVVVGDVVRVVDRRVDFNGKFGKKTVTYSWQTLEEKTAERLAKILEEYKGKTLLTVGMALMPND